MRNLKINIIISLLFLVILGSVQAVNAYWNKINTNNLNTQTSINIGSFIFKEVEPLDLDKQYNAGDTFTYDSRVWVITQSWFNPYLFLNTNGEVNYNYVKPYGPVSEVTNEYRNYNTYYVGDIVTHLGSTWIVRHKGANAQAPGTPTNAWNKINDINYYQYNTYSPGDIVVYQSKTYEALTTVYNYNPAQNSWAWKEIN